MRSAHESVASFWVSMRAKRRTLVIATLLLAAGTAWALTVLAPKGRLVLVGLTDQPLTVANGTLFSYLQHQILGLDPRFDVGGEVAAVDRVVLGGYVAMATTHRRIRAGEHEPLQRERNRFGHSNIHDTAQTFDVGVEQR